MLSIPQLSPKMTKAKTGKPSAVALTAIDYQTRGSWGRDGTTAREETSGETQASREARLKSMLEISTVSQQSLKQRSFLARWCTVSATMGYHSYLHSSSHCGRVSFLRFF